MKIKILGIILGFAFQFPCFSQNMLILGGSYSFFKPSFGDVGLGFNIELFNAHIQDDVMIVFGGLTAKNETGKEQGEFLFGGRDNLYYSLDGKFLGLRAGVSASFGFVTNSAFPDIFTLFFNGGGLAGICILPQSFISVTLDICPGYVVAFHVANDFKSAGMNDHGFSMPLSLSLRFNLDKL